MLLLLVALGAAWWLLPVAEWSRALVVWVDGLGPWAPVALGAAYVVACVLLIPGSIMTLGAGFLFGVVKGTATISIASTLGATAAFLAGRYALRGAVERMLERYPKFKAMDSAVALEGWKIVFLTRLSPIFPFNLLNYALGVTRVSLLDYVFASWAGMLPATVLYVYIGSLAGEVATANDHASPRSALAWMYYVAGLAATVVVTVYVTGLARRTLREAIDTREGDAP